MQLAPDVDQPIITVETDWTGRSPEEVEREITDEQEDKLKGISNLRKMTSESSLGKGEITLEFYVGTNIDRALQEVSDKLRQVPEYPEDVDEPVITAADSADANAMAWIILYSDDEAFDIQGFFDTADKRVKPHLERVAGVSRINIYGGRERQVHIRIDPRKLAQRGITFNHLRQALRAENVNVSAGQIEEGRLDVRIRTIGQYDDLENIRQTIVAQTDGGPVRVRDLGTVVLTLEKKRSFVRSRGQPGLAFQVVRETGANVMATMAELRQRIEQVNQEVLPRFEGQLRLKQVYDETIYIEDAIALVQNNLVIGGTLAILILLLFLRTVRPTLIIAISIPISIVGTFVVMRSFGRSLNVVSLAGLAFAVGMVVDNAIVVLENIDRHLNMGKPPLRAAYDAAQEVWGAVLASTLTTLAVFVPVLTLEEEAGQLFRDIALAICAAVALSLVVSITVIPSASSRFLRAASTSHTPLTTRFKELFGLVGWLDRMAHRFAGLIHFAIAPTRAGVLTRLGVVGLFTLFSLVGSAWLVPPTTYLPKGNRNLVFGIMFNPPGYNVQQNLSIGDRVELVAAPYWRATTMGQIAELDPVLNAFTGQPIQGIPPIDNFFFVSFGGTIFMGAASADKEVVAPLSDLLNAAMGSIPGSFGFAQQASIFGRGVGGSNAVDVELFAPDMTRLRASAEALQQSLAGEYGFGGVRPDPLNFNLAGPELRLKIDRVLAAELGVDVAALGLGVQTLIDGATVGDYRYRGESIDLLMVRDPGFPLTASTLAMVPVATTDRDGQPAGVIPLSTIAQLARADAPQQINHIEQLRSIKLTVVAPENVPLETLTNDVAATIERLRESGQIASGVEVNLAGTADKLTQLRRSLVGHWPGGIWAGVKSVLSSRMCLALVVIYLLMAALFESFLYPFVIMFSVPLATVGGFMGLALVHWWIPSQHLDVVTMLGFVILIGIVVNNAILIVHQALNFMKGIGQSADEVQEPLTPRAAISEAVRTRMRPVFMTTMTSVFGMLPLVLMPGSGSELYKGLGGVVVGGLVVATVFTLVVVPLTFSLVMDAQASLYHRLGWPLVEKHQASSSESASAADIRQSV